MTFSEERDMYCAICGGPIFRPGRWKDAPAWLSSAVLLCQKDYKGKKIADKNSTIVAASAVNKGGPYFAISSTDPPLDVTACDLDSLAFYLNPIPALYIPLHESCLSVINDVHASGSTTSAEKLLRSIWKVLRVRFVSSSKHRTIPPTSLDDGHGFYGIQQYHGMQWEGHQDDESTHEAQYYEADPIAIHTLTSVLLQNLQLLPNRPSAGPRDADVTWSTPEMVESVRAQLNRSSDQLEPTCTFEIPALIWKLALVEGSILPWLPAMDKEIIDAKEGEVIDEQPGWNWEMLVRQIAALTFRDGPTEMEKSGLQVPKELWNRRRIWQLVEDVLELCN